MGSEVQVLPDPPSNLVTSKVVEHWGHSSVGRAPALQAGGHRFDPVCLHHTLQIKAKAKAAVEGGRQAEAKQKDKKATSYF